MTDRSVPYALHVHRRELRRLVGFLVAFGALGAATYLSPKAQAVQPWVPGEPLPLVHLVKSGKTVQEGQQGQLVLRDAPQATVSDTPPSRVDDTGLSQDGVADAASADTGHISAAVPALVDRSPAVATPLVVPDGSLDHWFQALARAESGEQGLVVRALHWGDSTIAADRITGTVRSRLQQRFGDGGPGFLSVEVDRRWAVRPGIARWPKGDWDTKTITFGGSGHAKYGLAGTVSTATGEARSTLGGLKIDGQRQPLYHFDVFYMSQPDGGVLHIKPRGAPGASLPTASEGYGDRFYHLDSPQGSETVAVWSQGEGPVSVFGVALETDGPGVTWETFGVVGAGQGSMFRQGAKHIARQIAHRDPQLLVYMSGGNELSYPTLINGEGAKYKENYIRIMHRLQAGAPDASCLVITPLDQGERVRGEVHSKPMLDRMIRLQREAAGELNCAFWDAQHAMGGDGGFVRFLQHDPPLAWTDLHHLTAGGAALIGDSLADAIEAAYDQWASEHPELLPTPGEPSTPQAGEDTSASDDSPG